MSVKFICYPKCSTCKKAREWLVQNNVSFEERDIVTDRPSAQELAQWYRQSGLPLKRFFNTSGLAYRGLGLKDKLPGMAEEEQLALLATDGIDVYKRQDHSGYPDPYPALSVGQRLSPVI